jgi:hypothetical protein
MELTQLEGGQASMIRLASITASVVIAAGGLLRPAPIAGDIVHLKSGGFIKDCRIIEADDRVTGAENLLFLRTPGGRMGVPKDQVIRVEKGKTVFDDFDAQRAKLRDEDAQGLFKLARWCQETAGLREEMVELLGKVIAASPDHGEARRLLGYVKSGKSWKKLTPLRLTFHMSSRDVPADLQDTVRSQLSVALGIRKDVILDQGAAKARPDDRCSVKVTVEVGSSGAATFYGKEIRGPATHAMMTLDAGADAGWAKPAGSLTLKGEVMSSMPEPRTMAVMDGFTRNATGLHRFLDRIAEIRIRRQEAASGAAASR